VAAPELLIEGVGSPHNYALRPSQAQALRQADLVFWMGPGLEQFLVKPLDALAGDALVVALGTSAGLHTLATRSGGLRDGQDAQDGHPEGAHVDMHLWLDPRNAAAMVAAIAAALSAIDPQHAALYQANAVRIEGEIAMLDAELEARLAPVRERPFVVLHDGYHYLEARYGLHAVGAIAVDPLRRPGAGRLREIRARLAARDVECVFAEPQFTPALVETVVAGTGARTGVLDPLGADLEAGPGHYALLMAALAHALVTCLDPTQSG
jgi:zinc transport system substrate-binding protein